MGHMQCSDEATNLLRSQAHIWNHIFNFTNSMTLKCAIELEIPDIINNHGQPMMLSKLIEALPINKEKTHFVQRIMRILVHSGFFVKHNVPKSNYEKEEEECYSLTPASRLLLKDESVSMKRFLLAMLDPILLEPWQHMCEWLKNDDLNPFFTAHGSSLWDYAVSDQRFNVLFSHAMASDATLITRIVVKDFGRVFEGLKSLVDVGGGTGTVSKGIANSFTHLRCINFDLPHIVAGLEGSKNISHIGGDMFKEIPAADAVLLKWILHDWTDEECIKILKNCKKAISGNEIGGKVIIIDMVVDEKKMDERSYETQLFCDVLMMVNCVGKERNEKEWAKLFSTSGFTDYKIMPVLGLRSIIEVYP